MQIFMMIAALGMALIAVTGLLLYLNRGRGAKAAAHAAAEAEMPSPPPDRGADLYVIHASQNGMAERLAWQTAAALRCRGQTVEVLALGALDGASLAGMRRVLFVVSTFGEGEAPDPAQPFVRRAMSASVDLSGLEYALLALGDRVYPQFCAFGRRLDAWLQAQGARLLAARIEVNNGEAKALAHWDRLVHSLGGQGEVSAESQAPTRWRLVERVELNTGSLGLPCFHLAFEAVDAVPGSWQAGDTVSIAIPVTPAPRVPTAASEPLWRSYSIASVPEEGRLCLLVRQVRREDGQLGQGSGWLTRDLPMQGEIALHLREHADFHVTDGPQPLILIGNGTGLAALRAHLMQRKRLGRHENWLVFGERQRARDFHYRSQIEAWAVSGHLARLSLAFSRDGDGPRYVQDSLRAQSEVLCQWVDRGAWVLVSGSAKGMATEVDTALREVLGAARYDALLAQGRYRRDVY